MPVDTIQPMTDSAPEGGKARRVYLSLKADILSGTFAEGDALPGEHKLAAMHDVSRVTVRRALDALAHDGLIEKRVGSGSIVRAQPGNQHTVTADIATLMPQLAQMAEKTEARLLSFAYVPASAALCEALGLPEGARVQRAVRVRYLEGKPFSYLITNVPEDVAASYSEADLATKPLYALLELGGVRIESAHQSVSALLASPDIAGALDVPVGSALLSLARVVRDEGGRGVEHLTAHYRPDRFQLSMSLERVGSPDNRHWAPIVAVAAQPAPVRKSDKRQAAEAAS